MFRRKIACLLTALTLALGCAVTAGAAEVDCDSTYCFKSQDFAEAITGICVTGLPQGDAGTVRLGQRIIRTGDILTARQLEQLTFTPMKSREDREALLTYLPIRKTHVDKEATLTLSIRGREDKLPQAQDMALETYRNLPLDGRLKAADPENQALTYTIIRQTRRGAVELREDGSFTYTPKRNKVGTDSFTYTAADPAGQVSREATVTIDILKPEEDSRYTDTAASSCRFTAEWMKNTGIFSGEQMGESLCFNPDKSVTRGEFLAMLMDTLSLPGDGQAKHTGFSDEAPGWLRPYLAAALRQGLVTGYTGGQTPVFAPGKPISPVEAASMIRQALALPVSVSSSDLPAGGALEAVAQAGLELPEKAVLTRSDAANLLYQISRIMRDDPEGTEK